MCIHLHGCKPHSDTETVISGRLLLRILALCLFCSVFLLLSFINMCVFFFCRCCFNKCIWISTAVWFWWLFFAIISVYFDLFCMNVFFFLSFFFSFFSLFLLVHFLFISIIGHEDVVVALTMHSNTYTLDVVLHYDSLYFFRSVAIWLAASLYITYRIHYNLIYRFCFE